MEGGEGRERSGKQQGGMGEGGGLGTEGRGRCGAAGPSSSVGTRCLWVGGCSVRGRSSCGGGASLSMGGASSSVGGPSHPCVRGVVVHGWGLFFVPGRCWLWATTVVTCGCWASFMGAGSLSVGAGSLFVGPGLSIVGGGARLHGRVGRGCWFVVHGRGGDVMCAGWGVMLCAGWGDVCWVGDVLCAGWSPLARLDRMREGVLTKQQQ